MTYNDEKKLNKLQDLTPKREAFKVGFIYFIISTLWISFSDELLYKYIGEISKYKKFQTYKGWFFVIVSTMIIYFLVYKRVKKVRDISLILIDSMEELTATNEGLVKAKLKLNREQVFTENLMENSTLIIFTWDLDGKITSFNPYAEKITGYSAKEIIGKSWVDMFLYEEEKHKLHGLVRYIKSGKSIKNSVGSIWKTKNGRDIELIWTDSPIFDENGQVCKIISFGTDITHQKNLVRRLNDLAYYDNLTKLPNRVLFKSEGEKLIRQGALKNLKLAFLYINLDNFKQINDSLGHEYGDELLINIANNLKDEIREKDYLASLGKDEYAIILYDVMNNNDAIDRTEKVLKCINAPWLVNEHEFEITASIGVSLFPQDAQDYSSLLKYANMAMYSTKELGKNGFDFYRVEMEEKVINNTFIINQIKRAIDERQFTLHYQPLVDISTNKLVGVEALLRWYHPDRGYIPPLDYIPLIEETGHIFDITSMIFNMAFEQKKAWNKKGFKDLRLGINISSKSLVKGGLDDEIKELLNQYDIKPEEIILEITETAFMDNLDKSIHCMKRVEDLGVKIALDDFGTGYSSLSQLRFLPIAYVKIDQGFIRTMKRHSEEEIVVKSIIDLGHTLGLTIIVEGIETQEQLDILKESKCDLGQGYFLAKPMSAEDFENIYLR